MTAAVESEDVAAGGGVGKEAVVARVVSSQKLRRRDIILFSVEKTLVGLEGVDG